MLGRLRSYFVHHRAERRGSIAVLVISMVILSLAILLPGLYAPAPLADESSLRMLQSFAGNAANNALASNDQAPQPAPSLFAFDPNVLSDSGFTALGFTQKELVTLRKYMAAGASFREKDDFRRLYFMDETRFDSLRPYLVLPDKATRQKPKFQSIQRDTTKWSDTASYSQYRFNAIIADLNHSDTNELKKVPGIGSYYAKRIVEYRNELGGYHDLGQLLELWKMTTENLDRFAGKVSIDKQAILKIKVNRATTQALAAHPYIDFKHANVMVTYREAHGPFGSLEDMVQAGLLNEDLSLKLAPYLQFE
jgi:DNA uptake protein ComE-like DNA-binding protein